MSDSSASDLEPCRHCGTKTAQRINGKAYCSMDCVQYRAHIHTEAPTTFHCPYPGCDWSVSYYEQSDLSTKEAYEEIEDHRNAHSEGSETDAASDTGQR